MFKFEELAKALDGYVFVEIYDKLGDMIFKGKLKDLKYMPDNVVKIVPQSTSREIYLEIYTY